MGGRAHHDGADRVRQPTGVEHQLGPEQLPRSRPRVLPVEDVRARKAELEAKGVQFYTDVNVVDEGPLAGWRWVYFSDPDGLALELVEIAYYLEDERRSRRPRPRTCANVPRSSPIEAQPGSEDATPGWPFRTFGTEQRRLGESASTWTGSARSGSPGSGRARGVDARRPADASTSHNIRYMTADPHRDVGDRQADPLRPPPPRRRPDRLGLRFGGAPPPAVQPVARPRPRPRRLARPAVRRSRRAGRHLRPCAAPSRRPPGSPTTSPPRSTTSSPTSV